MANERSVTVLSAEDYEAIEAAVMETARGRWFLMEYARRNRHADTNLLLDALSRLERSIGRPAATGSDFRLRRDLSDMADSIQQTKRDIARSIAESSRDARLPPAETVFDEVVNLAERADTEAFNAAEHVQEIAWSLREGVQSQDLCDDLDRHAIEIYRASNQHALTTNRVRTILTVLRTMESRLQDMVEDWTAGPHLVDDKGSDWRTTEISGTSDLVLSANPGFQRDDIVFAEPGWSADRRKSEPAPANDVYEPSPDLPSFTSTEETEQGPAKAFAEIDALPDARKLALFV